MRLDIGICGATGRVGKLILQKVVAFSNIKIMEKFNSSNDLSDLDKFCKNSKVIIDFSSPEILDKLLENAVAHSSKLVIGTTGFSQKQFDLIEKASFSIPILYSPNMSFGANLISLFAAKLGDFLNDYDVDIIDYHHRFKKDAPSGTALMIGTDIAKARFSSIRAGGIVGKHEVLFSGLDEIISIKHDVLNRDCFAIGALKAAIWISDKEKGLYSMKDMFSF